MHLAQIKSAEWTYKKGVAQLLHRGSAMITIKFDGRSSDLYVGNRRLQIKKIGFWRPEIVILDRGTKLLHQQQVGFWGCTYEVRIGNKSYVGKSRVGSHYRVSYANAQGKEVVSYDLNSWKWKPKAEFRINETAAPIDDLAMLLIVGYITLRKIKYETDGSVAVIATAS